MDTRMTKRRNFSDQFKAAVALEALRGDKTVQEIAAKRQLHPTQVSTWKRREMIRKDSTKLSLTRQCKLLKISRSSIYYTAVGVNAETLKSG